MVPKGKWAGSKNAAKHILLKIMLKCYKIRAGFLLVEILNLRIVFVK